MNGVQYLVLVCNPVAKYVSNLRDALLQQVQNRWCCRGQPQPCDWFLLMRTPSNCHDTSATAGRLTYVDGCVYEGMWQADKRHGVGTYYSTNGDIFVGTYVSDKRHGLGTTYMPSRGQSTNCHVEATGSCIIQVANSSPE